MKIEDALFYANKVILGADYGLYQHCLNVAGISHSACLELGLDEELGFCSGLLHDCGKVVWLNNPLCFNFMEHPELSYALLKDSNIDVATIAYMHHSYQINKYPEVCEIEVPDRLEIYCQLISFVDKVEANMARSRARPEDAINTMSKIYMFNPEIIEVVKDIVTTRSEYPVI
jgi:putative nucleotidyltransferase with HDIG domain